MPIEHIAGCAGASGMHVRSNLSIHRQTYNLKKIEVSGRMVLPFPRSLEGLTFLFDPLDKA
jgi:hypothetical protein